MYCTRVCVPPNKETQRESYILQGFVCFGLKKHNVNHVCYKGLCASEDRDAAWIMYFTRVCVPPRTETQRESRISQGFVCLRLKKHSVNHVFYKDLCASEQRNTACITYFTRVCVLQNKETQCESRILQRFVCLRGQRRSVNHVFYKGLCASE